MLKTRKRKVVGVCLALVGGCAALVTTASQAAQGKADAPEKAADARDKIICKRFVRTGSLADSYRTCKTKWEWERERENVRQLNAANSCRNVAEGGSCN